MSTEAFEYIMGIFMNCIWIFMIEACIFNKLKFKHYVIESVVIFLVACWFSPFFLVDSNLNPFDYANITDINFNALVDNDDSTKISSAQITETVTFDINSVFESKPYREIWIPLAEYNSDGLRTNFEVESVYQILDDGSKVEWKNNGSLKTLSIDYSVNQKTWYYSPGPYNYNREQYECIMLYPGDVVKDKLTFEVKYRMNNVILKYNDCTELYFSMLSEDYVNHLNSFKAQIRLPEGKIPKKENTLVYTYGTANNYFKYSSDYANNGEFVYYIDLDKSDLKFSSDKEYIEFALITFNEDKYIFGEVQNVNKYYYDNVLDEIKEERAEYIEDYQKSILYKLLVCAITFLIALLYSVYICFKTKNNLKNDKTSCALIPGKIDLLFVAQMMSLINDKKFNIENVYSAIMLSLVRKKYITINRKNVNEDWTSENTVLKILPRESSSFINYNDFNNAPKEELTPSEDLFLKLLDRYSRGHEVTLLTIESSIWSDYDYSASFFENMKILMRNYGMKNNFISKYYFDDTSNSIKNVSKVSLIFGIIFLLLSLHAFNIVLAVEFILGVSLTCYSFILKKTAYQYLALTNFGAEQLSNWQKLYNYLDDEQNYQSSTFNEESDIELYCIYATAFGLDNNLVKNLKINWASFNDEIYRGNGYFHSRYFHHCSHRIHHNMNFAIKYSYTGSSYSSGGRGFGGGG